MTHNLETAPSPQQKIPTARWDQYTYGVDLRGYSSDDGRVSPMGQFFNDSLDKVGDTSTLELLENPEEVVWRQEDDDADWRLVAVMDRMPALAEIRDSHTGLFARNAINLAEAEVSPGKRSLQRKEGESRNTEPCYMTTLSDGTPAVIRLAQRHLSTEELSYSGSALLLQIRRAHEDDKPWTDKGGSSIRKIGRRVLSRATR